MHLESPWLLERSITGPAVPCYLLGVVEFEDVLALQRRLVYEVSGGDPPALILCEHPPILTIGRHGSQAHIEFEDVELRLRGWPKRWTNRGGGCWLQTPGQIAIYPVLPLGRLGLTLGELRGRLRQAIVATLADFTVAGRVRSGSPDVCVGSRPIACLGLAVRDDVTYFGAVFNLHPDLQPFHRLRTGKDHLPMTSLERERHGPVRPALVRQRLLEHLATQLGFGETILFTEHPRLGRKAVAHAAVAAR